MGSAFECIIPVAIALTAWACIVWSRNRRFPLPPGPNAKSNAKSIGIASLWDKPWLTYASWSKDYGPIISYSVRGKKAVIINSAKVATDLLESRSSIYSDRVSSWMLGELGNRKLSVFVISSSNPRFKTYRRLMQSGLNPRASRDYRPIQVHETRVLLKDLASRPQDFMLSVRRNAVAVAVKLAYGYEMGGHDDELVGVIEEALKAAADLATPGRYLVEALPILRFLPNWFPGAGFKTHARKMGAVLDHSDSVPFEWALKQIGTGDYIESFISKQLRSETRYINPDEKEDIIKRCSGALFAGGADTTVSALCTFFLLMQLYPEIQKRAQSEVARVAVDRLPTMDDYDSLPYIVALIKEILRWGPVAPLGIPHSVTEDDVYEGYLIPKGTKVIANIWAITHDEDLYPEPFQFDPERHLGENRQSDPFKYVFGFGRRVCPGAHFAEMSLFLNITNILAVFNISKARNSDGTEIQPSISWSTGVTSHLKPFSCQITIRSNDLLSTIS